MIAIQNSVMNQYDTVLKAHEIPVSQHAEYKKWLRFFYDFCAKYSVHDSRSEQVRLFSEKLRNKKQTEAQCRQAAHAVSLYFELQKQEPKQIEKSTIVSSVIATPPLYQSTATRRMSQYSVAGYEEKSDSPEWDALLEKMAGEIKVRHYSRKTLQAYAQWSRRFQHFLKNKPPQDLTAADVKEYLTYLAVKCKVAASTQNQAFNSLLFLFRRALKRDFGILNGVPRSKKSLYKIGRAHV